MTKFQRDDPRNARRKNVSRGGNRCCFVFFQIDQSSDRLSTTRFRNRRRVKPIMTKIGTIRDLSSCDSVGRLRGGNLRMAKLMTDWPPHKILIKT